MELTELRSSGRQRLECGTPKTSTQTHRENITINIEGRSVMKDVINNVGKLVSSLLNDRGELGLSCRLKNPQNKTVLPKCSYTHRFAWIQCCVKVDLNSIKYSFSHTQKTRKFWQISYHFGIYVAVSLKLGLTILKTHEVGTTFKGCKTVLYTMCLWYENTQSNDVVILKYAPNVTWPFNVPKTICRCDQTDRL